MVKDLTKGNVRPVLWSFTIPMFISVVFQQLYNIADSAIAGRFAGEDALAAVGASYPITMIFMAIAIGCNVGCAVVISSYFGAGDIRRMKTAISTTLIASTVLAVALTIFGLLTSSYLMQMMNTPHNIFDAGDIYLKIYIGGMVFLFCYNVATGIFTALGDSKTPLYFLIGSSVGNVVLDYLFVAVFHFGVSGVGWATFLAQGIAGILAVITLLRRVAKLPTGHGKVMLYSKSMLRRIAKIAVPSILQQSFVSVGNIFIQSLVNSFGSAVIAGYSAAIKLNTFTITSFSTLGNALSSFSAQNIGAAKIDRVRKGFRAGTMLAWIIAVPFFVLFFFFGNEMLRIFMENPTGGAMKGDGIFEDRIAVLFYYFIKTAGGRITAWKQCDDRIYGFYLYRSDPSRDFGLCFCRHIWKYRNLDVLAGWMEYISNYFVVVLPIYMEAIIS